GMQFHIMQRAIADLVAAKRGGDELSRGPAIPVIDAFLEAELQRLEGVAIGLTSTRSPDDEGLNRLLRRFVYRA
ncbi:DNA polymerase beta superfamily protein, partial [Tepidimonas sp.]|uniref:DNA polymerase beta superfamily protein n=1 Tax=Tepidimonas sp. TaxID=2002775 RepID=UPI00391C8FFD